MQWHPGFVREVSYETEWMVSSIRFPAAQEVDDLYGDAAYDLFASLGEALFGLCSRGCGLFDPGFGVSPGRLHSLLDEFPRLIA